MSNLSFRPRPLDIAKPLTVITTTDVWDDTTAMRSVPDMPTGMEREEEMEAHIKNIVRQKVNNLAPIIPTPMYSEVPSYAIEEFAVPYERPSSTYIVYQEKSEEELALIVEYDADSEDRRFISKFNFLRPGFGLDETILEVMIDTFEKENFRAPTEPFTVEQAQAACSKPFHPEVVAQVYKHWKEKRERHANGDFLTLRFKFPRKAIPDLAALKKLRQLRKDLDRLRTLCDMVHNRERLKQKSMEMSAALFEKMVASGDFSPMNFQPFVTPIAQSMETAPAVHEAQALPTHISQSLPRAPVASHTNSATSRSSGIPGTNNVSTDFHTSRTKVHGAEQKKPSASYFSDEEEDDDESSSDSLYCPGSSSEGESFTTQHPRSFANVNSIPHNTPTSLSTSASLLAEPSPIHITVHAPHTSPQQSNSNTNTTYLPHIAAPPPTPSVCDFTQLLGFMQPIFPELFPDSPSVSDATPPRKASHIHKHTTTKDMTVDEDGILKASNTNNSASDGGGCPTLQTIIHGRARVDQCGRLVFSRCSVLKEPDNSSCTHPTCCRLCFHSVFAPSVHCSGCIESTRQQSTPRCVP
ncbi:ubiquitin hydrolase B [Pelomyxa schiedti]|nr:ubiquitin hydrolase B [Pelomyxa schiedti]